MKKRSIVFIAMLLIFVSASTFSFNWRNWRKMPAQVRQLASRVRLWWQNPKKKLEILLSKLDTPLN